MSKWTDLLFLPRCDIARRDTGLAIIGTWLIKIRATVARHGSSSSAPDFVCETGKDLRVWRLHFYWLLARHELKFFRGYGGDPFPSILEVPMNPVY